VANGFTDYGISKAGLIGTISRVNLESGDKLLIEYGERYNTQDLIKQVRTGGVVIVLLGVYRSGSQWHVTPDFNNAIGHFLIVDSVNMRSKTVRFAGSTLGMEQVGLADFVRSWSRNPNHQMDLKPGLSFLPQEPATNWALVIRRRR
jgi:hypothetical protein